MIQLMHGDCLELMQKIPDQSVDMVMCDLPYGTTACKWDTVIDLTKLWDQYKRVCVGAILLNAAQPFTSALIMSNPDWFRYAWIWEKPCGSNQTMAKAQPLRVHEDILMFCSKPAHNMAKDPAPYYPQGLVKYEKTRPQGTKVTDNLGAGRKRAEAYYQEFTGYPRSVLKFNYDKEKVHPTQKPVQLMEYLIKTYTNEGMTVLDNCMGSGTTGVACANTNRNFIGIERDDAYFKIAEQRIYDAELKVEADKIENLFEEVVTC